MVKEQTVDGQANLQATTNLTPAQSLCKHFGKSIYSTSLALTVLKMPSLMVEDAYVNHIPVMTGESGNQQ